MSHASPEGCIRKVAALISFKYPELTAKCVCVCVYTFHSHVAALIQFLFIGYLYQVNYLGRIVITRVHSRLIVTSCTNLEL